jgi:OPA family glycerol-3-phosphate transporter-like MFS transporter
MSLGAVVSLFVLHSWALGWTVIFMSLCVIGVHGMLSGTASMDFGGKKNAGLAVGIIDGAVYAGTALQSLLLGKILPSGDEAKITANWSNWPIALLPLSFLGLLLATRVWNARPQPKVAPAVAALSGTSTDPRGSARTGTGG